MKRDLGCAMEFKSRNSFYGAPEMLQTRLSYRVRLSLSDQQAPDTTVLWTLRTTFRELRFFIDRQL